MTGHNSNAFFEPLWRRWLVVAFVALWAFYEILVTGDTLWMPISLGMLAYGYWSLIRNWPDAKKDNPAPKE
jgi:hypothetical protein